MDTLSLTRERVRVWVCAPLPNTRKHWRRRRILLSGDFSRPSCTLSPTLSRNLTGEGARPIARKVAVTLTLEGRRYGVSAPRAVSVR